MESLLPQTPYTNPVYSANQPSNTPPAAAVASPWQLNTKMILGAGALLLCLVLGWIVFERITQGSRSVTVVGSARLMTQAARANMVVQYINRSNQRSTLGSTSQQSFETAMAKLKSLPGVSVQQSSPQIVTSSSLNPLYNSDQTDYRQSARVTVNDITQMPLVMNALNGSGLEVIQTTFSVSDDNTDSDVVLQNAVADAKQKAESLAKNSGGRIGTIRKVVENTQSLEAGTSILNEVIDNQTQIELSSSVVVEFELK